MMLRDGMAREAAAPGTGFRFTNGKDATSVCIPQYRDAFARLMRAGGGLNSTGCGWGDAQVQQLVAALVYAHANGATTQAGDLSLSTNELTDAAMAPLVDAIAAGALPPVDQLLLHGNPGLGDAGFATLRPVLAGPLSGLRVLSFGALLTAEGARSLVVLLADGHLAQLEILDLQRNRALGDAGAVAIAGALSERRLPELTELQLEETGMSDAGVRALAAALDGAPKLRKLTVGGNAFGEGGKAELKAACEKWEVQAMANYYQAL